MAETSPEYLAGLIVGIKEHLDRQDRQHEVDKQAAINAREAREARDDEKHRQNVIRLDAIDVKVDGTAAIARENRDWIDKEGKPLVGRVTKIETDDLVKKSRAAGAAMVWGTLGSLITIGITILGALVALKNGGLAAMAEFLNHG